MALDDMQSGGMRIPKGKGLFLLRRCASGDNRLCKQPDVPDFRRHASSRLASGRGLPQCQGRTPARRPHH